MDDDNRIAKDEMNLATLPISRLGRADTRDVIEYYGTFNDGDGQQEMVWTVRGAAGIGLPGELGERVLVALLAIGSQNSFEDRRMEFTTYQVLRILGLGVGGGNYAGVERAIAQLAGILITSDNAWVQKEEDGKLRRARVSKGFHLIDDYTLWNPDDSKDQSHIVWGERIWKNLRAGYIKNLSISFYLGLSNPLSRRLFRFLDKITYHRPSNPYEIDIFALANKLGMVPYEYAAHLKRPLAKAADELVERGWLAGYEFVKSGKFHRIRFCRTTQPDPIQLPLLQNCDPNCDSAPAAPDPLAEIWAAINTISPRLDGTRLLSIADGTATIKAGFYRDWIEAQLGKKVLAELRRVAEGVTSVVFVE